MGAMQQILLGMSSVAAPGQQAYTTAGTYSWVAPVGVTKVSVVAVGGGGGGTRGGGGGGGELRYGNSVSVIPGNSYSVIVAARGNSGTCLACATSGASSSFNVTSVIANGGTGYVFSGGISPGGSGGTGSGGGNGGSGKRGGAGGGGGAGGYAGNGGNGGYTDATAGAGGGGGGGESIVTSCGSGGGGGTGILGQNPSGAAGTGNNGGGGGSCGGNGTAGNGAVGGNGGAYGGGAGSGPNCCLTGPGGTASVGAVRIIWPGCARSFPSTRTANE